MLIIPTAFDFSDGIATNLEAGFPPYVEPFFQMEESDDDYDGPAEVPAEIQPPIDAAAPVPLGKAVKAYIVKYTAYRTFVDDSRSLQPLTDEMQPACDYLVYLLGGD
jgi:hypothetical protein